MADANTAPLSKKPRQNFRKRRQMSPEREERLFQQLEDLFLANGFSDFTVDDIASELRCSKPTLYALASSKEQLIIQTFKRFFREGRRVIEKELATVDSAKERVEVFFDITGEGIQRISQKCFSDALSFESTRDLWRQNATASANRLRDIIHEGISRGCFRPVHAEFVSEVAALVIDAIADGRLPHKTGISTRGALLELRQLVLMLLENGTPPKSSRRTNTKRSNNKAMR